MMDRFVDWFGNEKVRTKPFYNFGSGDWRHPHFQNVDITHPNYPNNKPDIEYDAFSLEPLPIVSDSAHIFYFSHVNEHLPDNINEFILSEVLRCLSPGALIRICYPDFRLACRAHGANDRSFFLHDWNRGKHAAEVRKDHPVTQLWLDYFATRAQIGSPADGNRKFSAAEVDDLISNLGYEETAKKISSQMSHEAQRAAPGCHINYWTHEKFEVFLSRAGFISITRSCYQQSSCPALRDPTYFDKNMPVLSGYVEAFKPQ